MQVLYNRLIKGEEKSKQEESGMKVTANQNCSAFVQVLERFSGVFSRENVIIRQLCKQLQQVLTFHMKEWEKMLVLKTLYSKKTKTSLSCTF